MFVAVKIGKGTEVLRVAVVVKVGRTCYMGHATLPSGGAVTSVRNDNEATRT